jgi:hypothetical protein
VEVEVQVQRGTEALDEGDRATLVGSDPRPPSYAAAQLCEERAQEGSQHFAGELRVVGAAIAKGVGKGEHPLPDRYLWQDAIYQVCSGVRHAAPATGRTEAAALARKGYEAIVPAVVAVEA